MTDPNVPAQPEDAGTPLTPPPVAQPEHWQSPTPPQYAAPPLPQYSAPQVPQAPQPPQYEAPHVQPQQAPYGQPQQHQYGQQPAGAYQSYAQPPFVPAPNYGAPGPGGYFDGASDSDDLSRPLYGASFGQSVRRFFRAYAKFDGRASRSEFWWIVLFSALVQFVPILVLLGLFGIAVSTTASSDPYSTGMSGAAVVVMLLGGLLMLGISLAMLIPSLALGWRRFHDAGFAGPLYLLSLGGIVPYIGWLANVAVLVLALMPSKVEGRRYDIR